MANNSFHLLEITKLLVITLNIGMKTSHIEVKDTNVAQIFSEHEPLLWSLLVIVFYLVGFLTRFPGNTWSSTQTSARFRACQTETSARDDWQA